MKKIITGLSLLLAMTSYAEVELRSPEDNQEIFEAFSRPNLQFSNPHCLVEHLKSPRHNSAIAIGLRVTRLSMSDSGVVMIAYGTKSNEERFPTGFMCPKK